MANPEQLEEQREETRLIIDELLEDGSDPDALYTIEHHLSADDLETLEKAAVEAFKLGYEVTDPEELEVEDGDIVICCDILSECALNADLIDAQVEQLMTLAEKFDVELSMMVGYLDGINDSLKESNPIEEMEEDTQVNLGFEKALLYKNMVAAEADWLYNLEEWNNIFDEDTRKALYKEQKASTTIVKEAKIYPNDPCPCGSGRKYKKCCGKK